MFRGAPADPPIVESVVPDSQAAKHGIQPGDRVTSVNGQRAANVEEAQLELLEIFGAGKPLAIGIAGEEKAKAWTLPATSERSLRVHPTQLYSLLDALLLCGFLLAYEPYKRRDGELTAWVLTIHPIARFLVEIISRRRGEERVPHRHDDLADDQRRDFHRRDCAVDLSVRAGPREQRTWPADLVVAT